MTKSPENDTKTKRSKSPKNKKPQSPKPPQFLTVANIENQKIERIQFSGEFYEAFRKPQNKGMWFVWGTSGSGKSTFLMMLAKEFAKTEKVLYNLLEEDTNDSDFIERVGLCQMNEVEGNFYAQQYNFEQLCYKLDQRNSPKVVFIDSMTYLTKDINKYFELKQKYPDKIFVISGHAEGKNPRTEFEKSIMYDAKMKIFVTGYLAVCKGRTIGPNGGRFIVWQEGYEKLRGAS